MKSGSRANLLEQIGQGPQAFLAKVTELTLVQGEDLVVEALKEGACDYLKKLALTPELLHQRVHGAMIASHTFATSA